MKSARVNLTASAREAPVRGVRGEGADLRGRTTNIFWRHLCAPQIIRAPKIVQALFFCVSLTMPPAGLKNIFKRPSAQGMTKIMKEERLINFWRDLCRGHKKKVRSTPLNPTSARSGLWLCGGCYPTRCNDSKFMRVISVSSFFVWEGKVLRLIFCKNVVTANLSELKK